VSKLGRLEMTRASSCVHAREYPKHRRIRASIKARLSGHNRGRKRRWTDRSRTIRLSPLQGKQRDAGADDSPLHRKRIPRGREGRAYRRRRPGDGNRRVFYSEDARRRRYHGGRIFPEMTAGTGGRGGERTSSRRESVLTMPVCECVRLQSAEKGKRENGKKRNRIIEWTSSASRRVPGVPRGTPRVHPGIPGTVMVSRLCERANSSPGAVPGHTGPFLPP